MHLRGYRLTQTLRWLRISSWVAAGILALLFAHGLVGLFWRGSQVLAREPKEANPGVAKQAQDGEVETARIEDFATVWEKLGPPPRPVASPEPAAKSEPPKPPPDPYPDMCLLGTITGAGTGCALIRIDQRRTKLLEEGQTYEDIRVLKVEEYEATVEVPNYTKTLRVQKGPGSETGR